MSITCNNITFVLLYSSFANSAAINYSLWKTCCYSNIKCLGPQNRAQIRALTNSLTSVWTLLVNFTMLEIFVYNLVISFNFILFLSATMEAGNLHDFNWKPMLWYIHLTPGCRTLRTVKYHGTCEKIMRTVNAEIPVSLHSHKKVWLISGSVKNLISNQFDRAHLDLYVHCFTISVLILLKFRYLRVRWYQMTYRILSYSEQLKEVQKLYRKTSRMWNLNWQELCIDSCATKLSCKHLVNASFCIKIEARVSTKNYDSQFSSPWEYAPTPLLEGKTQLPVEWSKQKVHEIHSVTVKCCTYINLVPMYISLP